MQIKILSLTSMTEVEISRMELLKFAGDCCFEAALQLQRHTASLV